VGMVKKWQMNSSLPETRRTTDVGLVLSKQDLELSGRRDIEGAKRNVGSDSLMVVVEIGRKCFVLKLLDLGCSHFGESEAYGINKQREGEEPSTTPPSVLYTTW